MKAQFSQLIVVVRYSGEKNSILKSLMSKPLIARPKAMICTISSNNFFIENLNNWKSKTRQICCDGALALLGRKCTFAVLVVKRHSLQVEVVHFYVYQYALISKMLPDF